MKTVLVLGASGATGKLAVQQLLEQNIKVISMVRKTSITSKNVYIHPNMQIVEANISDLSPLDLVAYLKECDAVISCLGHNLTVKGIFGRPRQLVTNTVEKIYYSLNMMNLDKKMKFILINSTGNSNDDIPEKPPLSQRAVISILRLLLPPHLDNENAADFLRLQVGQENKLVEWVVVRPDSLTHEKAVTEYDVHTSPIRNAIFNAAPSSRINVANFMSNLTINESLWQKWKGKMPVIYNHNT